MRYSQGSKYDLNHARDLVEKLGLETRDAVDQCNEQIARQDERLTRRTRELIKIIQDDLAWHERERKELDELYETFTSGCGFWTKYVRTPREWMKRHGAVWRTITEMYCLRDDLIALTIVLWSVLSY
jgi:hypothetical protein